MTASNQTLPSSQEWYTSAIQSMGMGFPIDHGGMCFGVRCETIIYMLSRDTARFDQLLFRLHQLSPVADKYKNLVTKLSEYKNEIQQQESELKSATAEQQFAALKKEKLMQLTHEEADLWEIAKLAYGISLFQLPHVFTEEKASNQDKKAWAVFSFFNSDSCQAELFQDLTQANIWQFLTPSGLQAKGGVVSVIKFTACYTPDELTIFHKMLRTTLTTNTKQPSAWSQSHGCHTIVAGIDPQNNPLSFVDANQLPTKFISTDEEMSRQTERGFFKSPYDSYVALTTTIFTTADNKAVLTENMQKYLLNTPEFKNIHKVTSDKAKFIGSDGSNLLYLAAREGETTRVEELVTHGAPINQVSHPDGWVPLTRAIRHHHTDTVRAILGGPANINITHSDNYTPLSLAVAQGNLDIVEMILNNYPTYNLTQTYGPKNQNLLQLTDDELIKLRLRFHIHALRTKTKLDNISTSIWHQISEFLETKDFFNFSFNKKTRDIVATSPRTVRLLGPDILEQYHSLQSVFTNLAELKDPLAAKNAYLTFISSIDGLPALAEHLINEMHLDPENQHTPANADFPTYQRVFCLLPHFQRANSLTPEINTRLILWNIFSKGNNHFILSFLGRIKNDFPNDYPAMRRSLFYMAAEENNIYLITQLILMLKESKDDTDRKIFNIVLEKCLTCWSGKDSHLVTIQKLVEAGASITSLIKKGISVLNFPIRSERLDILRFLLEQNIPEILESQNLYGHTPLYSLFLIQDITPSIKEKIMHSLLESGANPQAIDTLGRTILMLDSCTYDANLVKLFLEKGVNPHAIANNGITALMSAARKGNPKSVQLLLDKKVDVNIKSKMGMTAFKLAATENHCDIMQQLLHAGADIELNDYNGQPIPWLVKAANNKELLKLFLSRKVDVNARNEKGDTALIAIIKKFSHEISPAFNDNTIELLLEHKADARLKNQQGYSAFSYALLCCEKLETINNEQPHFHSQMKIGFNFWKKIILNLLKAGADPNDISPSEKTSRQIANLCCDLDDTSPKLLDILLKHPLTSENLTQTTTLEASTSRLFQTATHLPSTSPTSAFATKKLT